MELEDLQRIWDTQNDRPLYVIDDATLHKQIRLKKDRTDHIANSSEMLLMGVNLGAGCLLFVMNFAKPGRNLFIDLTALWMIGTAIYVLTNRMRRLKGEKRFDRSVRGDLDHALYVATYQVRLSRLMRWNVLPMAILIVFGMVQSHKSPWLTGFIVAVFIAAWLTGRFEQRFYRNRLRGLAALHKKLGPWLDNGAE